MPIPESIIVRAKIAGISEVRGKPQIALTIASFDSDYPTNCSDFPEGMDQAVRVGETHTLEITRQSMVKKKGSQEPSGDGSKPFHYYWGIKGRSEEPVTAFHPAATSQPSGNGLRDDPTGISIERQVAYKGAIELAVARIKEGETITMAEVLVETDMAAQTIHGGPVMLDAPPPDPHELPTDEQTQQEAFDALGDNHQEAEIGNLGAFMAAAVKAGTPNVSDVLKKLGVAKPVDIIPKYATFDVALAELKK